MGASSSSNSQKDLMIAQLRRENLALSQKVSNLEQSFEKFMQQMMSQHEKYQLDKNTITINNKSYTMIEKIGEGGFGVVYKAEREKRVYAIKKISDKDSIVKEIQFIIQVSEKLGPSAPIINIYGLDVVNNDCYIVMEFASGCLRDLFNAVQSGGGTRESEILPLCLIIYCFLLKALEFLESCHIVHGDIKPENFLIVPTDRYPWKINIKLIDFGTTHIVDYGKTHRSTRSAGVATIAYMAPERTDDMIHRSADVWSLGIMLYELVYDKLPDEFMSTLKQRNFLLSTSSIQLPKIENNRYQVFHEVMSECLKRDPKQRPSAIELFSKTIDIFDHLNQEKDVAGLLVILITVLKEAEQKEAMLELLSKRKK